MLGLGLSAYFKKVGENAGTTYFPVYAETTVNAPFFVSRRQNIDPYYTKDINENYRAYFDVQIVGKSYAESIKMAKKISQNAVPMSIDTNIDGTTITTKVIGVNLVAGDEDYIDGLFIQNFTAEIYFDETELNNN